MSTSVPNKINQRIEQHKLFGRLSHFISGIDCLMKARFDGDQLRNYRCAHTRFDWRITLPLLASIPSSWSLTLLFGEAFQVPREEGGHLSTALRSKRSGGRESARTGRRIQMEEPVSESRNNTFSQSLLQTAATIQFSEMDTNQADPITPHPSIQQTFGNDRCYQQEELSMAAVPKCHALFSLIPMPYNFLSLKQDTCVWQSTGHLMRSGRRKSRIAGVITFYACRRQGFIPGCMPTGGGHDPRWKTPFICSLQSFPGDLWASTIKLLARVPVAKVLQSNARHCSSILIPPWQWACLGAPTEWSSLHYEPIYIPSMRWGFEVKETTQFE